MAENDHDHAKGDGGVDDLHQLHVLHAEESEREHQDNSREAGRAAAEDGNPENCLLAEIEFARRRMASLDEQAPALGDPADVVTVGEVVPDPDHEHQQQAQNEGEGDVGVGELAPGSERGEGRLAQHGNQHMLAVKCVEAGQGKDDERRRRQPVGEDLEVREAPDHAPGEAAVDTDAPPEQEEHRGHHQHGGHGPPAILAEGAVAQGPPFVPFGLHQDACLLVGDGNRSRDPLAHQPPKLGIVDVAEGAARHPALGLGPGRVVEVRRAREAHQGGIPDPHGQPETTQCATQPSHDVIPRLKYASNYHKITGPVAGTRRAERPMPFRPAGNQEQRGVATVLRDFIDLPSVPHQRRGEGLVVPRQWRNRQPLSPSGWNQLPTFS